jgi:hypothetical protein
MKFLEKALLLVGVVLLLLIGYLLLNAYIFKSKQINVETATPIKIDKSAIQNFSKALRIIMCSLGFNTLNKTILKQFPEVLVSPYSVIGTTKISPRTFTGFHQYISTTIPKSLFMA